MANVMTVGERKNALALAIHPFNCLVGCALCDLTFLIYRSGTHGYICMFVFIFQALSNIHFA